MVAASVELERLGIFCIVTPIECGLSRIAFDQSRYYKTDKYKTDFAQSNETCCENSHNCLSGGFNDYESNASLSDKR